jgi:hypothetical protein
MSYGAGMRRTMPAGSARLPDTQLSCVLVHTTLRNDPAALSRILLGGPLGGGGHVVD